MAVYLRLNSRKFNLKQDTFSFLFLSDGKNKFKKIKQYINGKYKRTKA